MKSFISVSLNDLVDALALEAYADADQRGLFRVLTTLSANLVNYECSRVEEDLKGLFAAFNPDADTVEARSWDEASLRLQEERFMEKIQELFTLANYHELEREKFVEDIRVEAPSRLRVDLQMDRIDRLMLLVRGSGQRIIQRRKMSSFYRLEDVTLETFQRIAVVVKMRDERQIHLKLFKDVAKGDLEILLPTCQVRMTLLDRFKLGGSSGSAVISFIQLAMKAMVAMPFKILLALVVPGLFIIYGGKTYLDYRKIRDSYLSTMARNLYFLNIANNLGVISRLTDSRAEEQTKEAILAYHLLSRASQLLTSDELRAETEAFLRQRFRLQVKFDASEALLWLDRHHLIETETPGTGEPRYGVVAFKEAIQRLDAIWDGIYPPLQQGDDGGFVWVGLGQPVVSSNQVRLPASDARYVSAVAAAAEAEQEAGILASLRRMVRHFTRRAIPGPAPDGATSSAVGSEGHGPAGEARGGGSGQPSTSA